MNISGENWTGGIKSVDVITVVMEPTATSLSRTYSNRVYPDPWEKVLDYRRVREYAAENPNTGRVRVGRPTTPVRRG